MGRRQSAILTTGWDVIREDHSVNGITLYQNGLGIDDKLRSKNGTTVRYFLTDHLGSTEALADASGAIASSTSYDSFGNATSNIATTYRYTGREYDAETGLYYYRNRWYDPELGRFISKDPIGFAGGDINLYGYVGNSPYGFIDPYGFWRCPSDPPGSLGWWDVVQGALDVAGLTPVVGLPVDLLNAGISVARGNYGDAAFSMAAAVPVLGTAAGASKIAGKASKILSKSSGSKGASRTGLRNADDVIHVTPNGIVLPKGTKYKIPKHYVENPYGRTGSYGEIVNGKFQEKLRIDPATPPGKKGPNYSHYHKDGKRAHYSPRPGDRDPGF